MKPHQLVLLAAVGEGALVVVAVVWSRLREIPLSWGGLPEGVWAGAAGAVVLALVNWYLLRRAPEVAGIGAIRRLYQHTLKPAFGGLGAVDVLVISVAAGVGEELLFRGVLQPEVGLVPASLIFGLLHTGGSGTMAFGIWVAFMGAALGGLAVWTDGLLAPIIAHAVYDAAAMTYIRWDTRSSVSESDL